MFWYNSYELYFMMHGGLEKNPIRLRNIRNADKSIRDGVHEYYWRYYYRGDLANE